MSNILQKSCGKTATFLYNPTMPYMQFLFASQFDAA